MEADPLVHVLPLGADGRPLCDADGRLRCSRCTATGDRSQTARFMRTECFESADARAAARSGAARASARARSAGASAGSGSAAAASRSPTPPPASQGVAPASQGAAPPPEQTDFVARFLQRKAGAKAWVTDMKQALRARFGDAAHDGSQGGTAWNTLLRAMSCRAQRDRGGARRRTTTWICRLRTP